MCDKYVMLGGVKENVIFAKGKVIDAITRDGMEWLTIDGVYYFKKDGCEGYKVAIADSNEFGELMDFRLRSDLKYTPLSESCDHDGDILIDLSEATRKSIEQDVERSIGHFKCDASCTFNDKIHIAFESKEERAKFVTLLEYPPARLSEYISGYSLNGKDVATVKIKGHDVEWYLNAVKFKEYFVGLKKYGYFDYDNRDLVYHNNIGRKSFQWELWAMCNNLCTYCYLGKTNRGTNKERQLKSLEDCYKAICELDTYEYNNISLIGGEFFQGQLDDPEVHDAFFKLIRKICEYYRDGKIGSVWITCTLTIGDQHHLYEMLEMFKEYECYPKPEYGASGLWLCTSWDIQGRFHTPDRLENWEYHMKRLKTEYPWVKKNCTIILMQKFLEAYINGDWSPKKFCKEFDTCLFYKQIGLGELGNDIDSLSGGDYFKGYRIAKKLANEQFGFEFAPKRETMLKFLYKYAKEDPETYDRLYNIQYRADELHRNYNDVMKDMKTTRNKHSVNETDVESENKMNTCGHIINYACYVDSDKCCICDKKMVWDSIYGGI